MEKFTEQCISQIKKHLHLSYNKDIYIDFTAKKGYFIEVAKDLVDTALFYDPFPEHPAVMAVDFLNPFFNFDKFNKTYLSCLWFDDVHVIGCPPEAQAELCIAFACTFAQSVSFILPQHLNHAFPSNYQRLFTTPLEGTKCNFQIWLKADY